jgi:hypothetical protein
VTPSEKPQTPDLSNSLEGLVFFGMSKTIVPVNLFPGLVSSKKVLESSNRFEGREAVRDFITTFHTQLFDAHSEVKSLAIGDGIVALAADFVGTHGRVCRYCSYLSINLARV